MNAVVASGPAPRRCRGRAGSATVAALVLLFAFTSAGIVWLSRDVNRVVTHRSAAQSIAFQAARAGAQRVDVGSLRDGAAGVIVSGAAVESGRRHADTLMDAYGVRGEAEVRVDGDAVTVTVTIDDPSGAQSATATVEARTGP